MKISGSPGERLPGCISHAAGARAGGHGRLPPETKEERLPSAAHVEARYAGRAGNCPSIRHLVGYDLAVDLQDQVALADSGAVRAAPEIDAADADAAAVVPILLGRVLDRESERFLLAAQPRRGWRRVPWGARLLQEEDRNLERFSRAPDPDADSLARRGPGSQ